MPDPASMSSADVMPEAALAWATQAADTEAPGFDEAALRRVFAGRHVLLTGHSGFKGSWLALWLRRLGATVTGISLPPEQPSMHEAIRLDRLIDGRYADIRSADEFATALAQVDADIVIHMAAQAIVRRSHVDPVETFATNVTGTAVVLNAVRAMPRLKAIVVVTSDKCYENREWPWGYRETDTLGGSDPYSASKACTELVVASFRRSYFADPAGPQLATVRAGNVMGGGDWASDRLVPDMMRAALSGQPVFIRNPASIRPWQHVLDPLAGYLMVAAALVTEGASAADAWNFGPDPAVQVPAGDLARLVTAAWGAGAPLVRFGGANGPREAGTLSLDSARARARLGWQPRLPIDTAVAMTVEWYRAWGEGVANMAAFTEAQIAAYAAGAAAPRNFSAGAMQQCA